MNQHATAAGGRFKGWGSVAVTTKGADDAVAC
jgi:hypothetical protein